MNKKYRLASSIDFKRVRSQGTSFAHPLVVLVMLEEIQTFPQVGFVISKYVGNAVVRNRIRRQMREIVRSLLLDIKTDQKLVLIARSSIAKAPYSEIEKALRGLFAKGKLLKN